MTKDELITAYDEWLGKRAWNLFGTLTFRGFPSPSKADRIFRQWISEIYQQDGTDDFCWARVTEHGAYGDNLHYHVLIGGWRGASKFPWILHWEKLAGSADLFYYRPHAGGIRYMLKTVRPGCDFEIEMEFPSPTVSR